MIKLRSYCLLLLLFGSSYSSAQTVVESTDQSAGFRFSSNTGRAVSGMAINGVQDEPIVSYQQNLHMLMAVDDMPGLKIYGDGRVLVHYPPYMKKAGDYEMWLDSAELILLMRTLSDDGIMAFDETRLKNKLRVEQQAMKRQGYLSAVSDAVESVVDIRLDEYQRNRSSLRVSNFHKQFRWKNIEHDAKHFTQHDELQKANRSMVNLKRYMNDVRLVRKVR